MQQTETNKLVVRRLLEDFLSCDDPIIADEVVAAEFIDNNPSNAGLVGPDNLKRSVREWCLAFPDTRTSVDDMIAEEDRAAARWTSTATHRGTFLGIPATGAGVSVTGTGLFRVVDGRIVESWDHFDALGLLRQLRGTVAPRPVT